MRPPLTPPHPLGPPPRAAVAVVAPARPPTPPAADGDPPTASRAAASVPVVVQAVPLSPAAKALLAEWLRLPRGSAARSRFFRAFVLAPGTPEERLARWHKAIGRCVPPGTTGARARRSSIDDG